MNRIKCAFENERKRKIHIFCIFVCYYGGRCVQYNVLTISFMHISSMKWRAIIFYCHKFLNQITLKMPFELNELGYFFFFICCDNNRTITWDNATCLLSIIANICSYFISISQFYSLLLASFKIQIWITIGDANCAQHTINIKWGNAHFQRVFTFIWSDTSKTILFFELKIKFNNCENIRNFVYRNKAQFSWECDSESQ